MSTASVSISELPSSSNARLYFGIVLKTAAGEPVANTELRVKLDGGGSLSPAFSSKDVARETDARGSATVTWYRLGTWDRTVNGTLSVESPEPDQEVSLTPIDVSEVDNGPWISWTPQRRRF